AGDSARLPVRPRVLAAMIPVLGVLLLQRDDLGLDERIELLEHGTDSCRWHRHIIEDPRRARQPGAATRWPAAADRVVSGLGGRDLVDSRWPVSSSRPPGPRPSSLSHGLA